MKFLRVVGLAAVVAIVIACALGAGSASATVLCKTNTTPCGSKYGVFSSIEFRLSTGTKSVLKAGFATVECEESAIRGEIFGSEGGGGFEISIPLETLAFGKCNCTVKTLSTGNADLAWTSGTMNANVRAVNYEIEVKCGEIKSCRFGIVTNEKITFTGGNPAQLAAAEAPMTKVSGPATCLATSKWSAKYTATGLNTAIWIADS